MADEENYSEEEFGFSEDFEDTEEESEAFDDAAEFEADDDELSVAETEAPSGGSNMMRYGLFAIGLAALGFGGLQIYEMFSPSKPMSAFDKKSGSSLVSTLSSTPSPAPEMEKEDIPMAPQTSPMEQAAKPKQVKALDLPKQPEEPMQAVASVPSMPAMDKTDQASAANDLTVEKASSMPTPTPAEPKMDNASSAVPMEQTSSQAERPAPTIMEPATSPSAAATQPQKEVVVRYEMPTELINRQNSIESNMRTLQQRLISIEDTTRSYRDQNSTFKSDLEQISRTLKQLDTKLNKFERQISKVSDDMHTNKMMVHKRIQSMQKDMTVSKNASPMARKPHSAPEMYYIQAMIPGRAWIKSKKGSTLTIRRGSRIMGYGQVTQIDVENGRIVTTSGHTIRFHPSER